MEEVMKNKTNKKNRIMLKKIFTKEELLTMRKYPRLLAYKIPYDIVNRAYNRYIKNIDDYILKNGYPLYWFGKNRDVFSCAVRLYIESKKNNYTFDFGTRGYIQIEIVKVSGLDKYLDEMLFKI